MDWSALSSQNNLSLSHNSRMDWDRSAAAATAPSAFAGSAAGPTYNFPMSPGGQAQPFNLHLAAAANQPPNTDAPRTESDKWEDLVAQHERKMIDRVIQRAENNVRKQVDQLLEQHLQAGWKREREKWLKEILGTPSGSSSTTSLVPVHEPSGNESPWWNNPTSSFSRRPSPGSASDHLDPSFVRAHLNIMTSSSDLAFTAAQMSALNLPPRDLSRSYQLMWHYIEQLLKLKLDSPSTLEQSIAYLMFLCKQTQTYIINRVRAASLAGSPHIASGSQYRNSMASTCASFVKLTIGDSKSLWPVAYYCLRSGDAVAASEVVVAMGLHQSDQQSHASVLRLVDSMAAAQGSGICIWEGSPVSLDASDRQAVAVLLESARDQEHQDAFQVGFLTLCCATDLLPSPESLFGFSSVEDYLCGALWKAILAPQPQDELISFGEQISSFGISYFGDNLLPFLVAQQYELLLSHLGKNFGRLGLMFATHLAIILTSAGVSLVNLKRGANDETNKLDSMLTVAYSEMLLTDSSFGIPPAFEYLARIPNKVLACGEVAALIAKTGRTDELAGSLNADGVRTGPALLDKHFSSDEISNILNTAASQLLHNKNDRNKMSTAVLCLSLAGKYADSLAVMGNLLSPPDVTDALREHWMNQAETFYKNFLSKRTHVVDVLEKENKASYMNLIRKMIDLNRFFQLYRDRKMAEGWALLEQIDLLPSSQQDMTLKASVFPHLDPLLKQAMPSVMVAAVWLLHTEYTRIRQGTLQTSSSQPVSHERLRELKEKIQMIAAYSSIAGLSLTHEQLTSLNHVASVVS